MRKKWVVIAVIVAALLGVLMLATTLANHNTNKKAQQKADLGSSCKQFIVNVQKGNTDAAYAFLDPSFKTQLTDQSIDWKTQAASLKGAWGTNAPQLQRQDAYPSGATTDTTTDPNAPVYEMYTITLGGYTYDATCTLVTTNGKQLITAFSSQIENQ
jgi:type II secretory pathway pseudopilin PulG